MTAAVERLRGRWRTWLVWIGVAVVLGASLLAYLRPDFIVDLAGRMFLCS